MPSDTSPRIVRRSSVNPPGSVAPDGAYGTTMPATMFGRPAHDARLPAAVVDVDEADLVGVRVRRSTSRIRAAITPPISRPGSSTPSTSSPSWFERRDDVGRPAAVDRRERRRIGEDAALTHQYCARNRTSSSKKVLISSMP